MSSSHPVYGWEVAPTSRALPAVEPDPDPVDAERLASRDIWRVAASTKPAGGPLTPLTLEWFKHLDDKRYRNHGHWVPSLFEFDRHVDEHLLAVGDGLGLDWARYAEGKAHVTIVDPSADRLRLYKTHFSVRGLAAQFQHAPYDHLSSPDERVDVVCAFFNDPPNVSWPAALAEAYRVLRPGGKALIVLPSHFNAARWQRALIPWHWFRTEPKGRPRFTKKELRDAFAAFNDVTIYKRHLRRSELPFIWRWMFLPLAERFIGRFLVVKAFKPLMPQSATRAAA